MNKILLTIIFGLMFVACEDENEPRTFTEPPITDTSAWVVDANQFEHFMTIVAEVHLDGDPVCGLENKIVAFSDMDVRGVSEAYSHLDCAVYNIIVYSNNLEETITFGVYMADEDQTAICTDEITFESGVGLGEPDAPYILEIE